MEEIDDEKSLIDSIIKNPPLEVGNMQVRIRVAPPTAEYTMARIIISDVSENETWTSGNILIRGTVTSFGEALNKWRGTYTYPAPQPVREKGDNSKYQPYIDKYLQIFDLVGNTPTLVSYRTQLWQEYKRNQLTSGKKKVEVSKELGSFRDALDYALAKWKEQRTSFGW